MLGLLLLTACINEDYVRPKLPVNPAWDVQDDFSQRVANNLAYLQWWDDFKDPTLKALMSAALQCNQQLLISKSRIDAALGEVKKVKNQWIPNADFWTGYANNPIYGFPGALFVFVPSYFINFYQQHQQFKISKLQLAESKADDDVIKLMVIAQVANSYFGYQAYKDYLLRLEVLKSDLVKRQSIAQAMYNDGLIADIEPHQIYNELMLVEGEYYLAQKNIIRFRNALRYLLNKNPGKITTTREFTDLIKKPQVVKEVPMHVLLNRPDLKVAEYRLKAAFYNIKLAHSPFVPRFEFDMFPGWVATNNAYRIPRTYLKFNDQLLKVKVFQWSVLGEIDKAKAQKKAIFYEFLDTLRKVLRDTSTAYENHDKATKNLLALEQATQELYQVYQRHKSLTQQGIQSEFITLAYKIQYDRIRLLLNRAQLQQLLSIVRLYQELAAGYKDSALASVH